MLYFCIPANEKLLGYWDTVADRLYKIRHCMNIDGVVRQLALFEPPIDPGVLVKAVAAGLDINAALAGLNEPLPLSTVSTCSAKSNESAASPICWRRLLRRSRRRTARLALLRIVMKSRCWNPSQRFSTH